MFPERQPSRWALWFSWSIWSLSFIWFLWSIWFLWFAWWVCRSGQPDDQIDQTNSPRPARPALLALCPTDKTDEIDHSRPAPLASPARAPLTRPNPHGEPPISGAAREKSLLPDLGPPQAAVRCSKKWRMSPLSSSSLSCSPPKGEAVVAVPPAKMRWTIASTARRLGYNVR